MLNVEVEGAINTRRSEEEKRTLNVERLMWAAFASPSPLERVGGEVVCWMLDGVREGRDLVASLSPWGRGPGRGFLLHN
jgi:hypothetical protein